MDKVELTKRVESRAAKASMSAQDTTPLHWLSTADFIASTTSNPLAEFKLAAENFSTSVPSSKTDPSQPCYQNFLIKQINVSDIIPTKPSLENKRHHLH